MRSLVLLTGAIIPNWVEYLATHVNNSGIRKVILVQLEFLTSPKTKIRNFYFINLLEKLSGLKASFDPFKISSLKADFKINSPSELVELFGSNISGEVLFCGSSSELSQIHLDTDLQVLLFHDIVTDSRQKEITYNAFLENASVIEFNLVEQTLNGIQVLNSAKCKANKYSLQANREKYTVLAWLVINYLSRKNSGETPYIALSKNALKQSSNVGIPAKLFSFIVEKIKYKTKKERWILGTTICNDFEMLPQSDFEIIETEKGIGIADPFVVEFNNEKVIFAEYIDEKWKGSIVAVRKDRVGNNHFNDILKEKYHLSYPYIFKWKNALYMVPESSENKDVTVYKCTNFPLEWQKEKVIIENTELVDSTIFEKDNIWWLLANGKKFTSSFNEELFIYYSDSPLGPWQPHKMNPVKIDISGSRPAGNIVVKNDKIYRPAQDCAIRYGYKINWMEIEVLTETEFREKKYSETLPDWTNGLVATHNFSYWNNNVVLDGFISK